MPKPLELLQGTLDMLILKAVSLGLRHGYGIWLRIHRYPETACRSSNAHSIWRSTIWNDGLIASEVNRGTSVKPSGIA